MCTKFFADQYDIMLRFKHLEANEPAENHTEAESLSRRWREKSATDAAVDEAPRPWAEEGPRRYRQQS